MARARQYPLAPLARLREARADEKTRALGAAIAARETAEGRRDRAEAERAAARAGADALRLGERGALERGALSVRDLARGGAWEQRVGAEDLERGRGVERLREVVEGASVAEARSRCDVASAQADVETLARHQARWTATRCRDEELREEEEMAEAAPRKRAP